MMILALIYAIKAQSSNLISRKMSNTTNDIKGNIPEMIKHMCIYTQMLHN